MRPVETRFGLCAPSVEKAIASLSTLWGEAIVSCGGAAANALGLTTQHPVRPVYLTSGPSRRLRRTPGDGGVRRPFNGRAPRASAGRVRCDGLPAGSDVSRRPLVHKEL